MRNTLLISACTAGLLVSLPANSQTTGIRNVEDIAFADQIIVTAARRPMVQRRIGSAVTVISRQDIENRQSRYLTDILRSVPGFSISHSGGVGTQTQVRVRGGEGNQVLVLIDGVRANDPATDDEFRWEHFSTANIERIEIVRGPQSALWGSDAVSAVVNIVSRQDSGASFYNGYVETGSNDSVNLGATASAGIGSWQLSGGMESLETEGSNISRTGTEADGAKLAAASFGASFANQSGFSLKASLRASDTMSQYDADDFFVTGLPIDGDVETHSDSTVAQLSTSFQTGDGRLTWHLRSNRYESEHQNFLDGTADSSTASDRTGFVLQTDIQLGRNTLSLAAEHEDTNFTQRGPMDFGDPNQDQSSDVTSTVAEYQSVAGERLSWTVGARHDKYSDFDNALTGKISLAFQQSDSLRLRTSVGTGQKAPTFIERFGYYPSQFLGNSELEPETSLSYEIGADRDFANGAVSLSSTAYWQELENEIDGFYFDLDSGMYTAVNLTGASKRKGLETVVSWNISDRFRFGANHTYTDSTEPDEDNGQLRELRRPRHAGNLNLSYSSPGQRIGIDLAADYGGTREDVYFPPWPEPSQQLELSDYWLVDLAAQYRLGESLTFFARVSNLLDEHYEQVFGYATPGRAAFVGLRTHFDR